MTTVSPVSFFPPAGVSSVDGASPGDGNDEFAAALSQTTRKLTGDKEGSEASTDKAPSGDSIGATENSGDAEAFVWESATMKMVEGGVGGASGGEQLSASDAAVDALDVQGVTTGAYAGTEESATAYSIGDAVAGSPAEVKLTGVSTEAPSTGELGKNGPTPVVVANVQSPTDQVGRANSRVAVLEQVTAGSHSQLASQAATEGKSALQGAAQNPTQGAAQNPTQGAAQNPTQGAAQNPAQGVSDVVAEPAVTQRPSDTTRPIGQASETSPVRQLTAHPGEDGEASSSPATSHRAVTELPTSETSASRETSGAASKQGLGREGPSPSVVGNPVDRSTSVSGAPLRNPGQAASEASEAVATSRLQPMAAEADASIEARSAGTPASSVSAGPQGASNVTAPSSTPAAQAPTASADARAAETPVSYQLSAHLSNFRGRPDGSYETTMSLRPAELGQVTVKIQVNNGMVSLQATGMTVVAVEALREAMPDLREDLLRSGLDLVDSHVDRDPSSFGDDDSTSSLEGSAREKLESTESVSTTEASDLAATEISEIDDSGEGGRVDIRV
ncbi:MAG: flagellar hook-length control protein FliK [Acidimicrobiales bacterium]|nr:MAG: flagellar hook-length control protein FliK [Acidimicrobiales bacterium]